jgi:phage FluMu protein Com
MAMLSSSIGGYLADRLRARWVGVHTTEVQFRDTAHGFLAWAVASVLGTVLLASPSTQQYLSAIKRPRCPRCQTRMMLERYSSGPTGFEQRVLECPKCDHVEVKVTESDPFTSTAAGWIDAELRPPT